MRTTCFLTVLIFFNTIFAQVGFNYNFSLDKVNPQDELVRIWVDDLDENGIDEIYAGYKYSYNLTNTYEWRIITYNLNGEIISVSEQLNDIPIYLTNCTTFKTDSSTYLITAINRTDSSSGISQYYLDVEIYDFSSLEIIDVISIYIGHYDPISGTRLSNVSYINPTIIQDTLAFNVGITKHDYYYWPDDDDEAHTNYTELLKFSFNNEILELTESIEDCGNSFNKYNNYETIISTGYFNYSYFWPGQEFEATNIYYVNLINQSNPSQITNVLNIEGDSGIGYFENYPTNFNILSNNDENFLNYGFAIYFRILGTDIGDTENFINYSLDFSDSIWVDQNPDFTANPIIISTCISVNNENHYLMYFRDNQLEIRDRINGNIIHNQVSSINPFSINRKSDGELIFITENGNSFDVFTLLEEIQVSVNDHQISEINYNLQNFPNPFNPSTTINFSIQIDSIIKLSIYNIKGQKIKTLANEEFTKGDYSIIWDGNNQSGKSVSSGVYYYIMKVDGKIKAIKKCLLLK